MKTLSVPIEMFFKAQEQNYLKILQFYLSMKLLYPCGKIMLTEDNLIKLEWFNTIKSRKTTRAYIKWLVTKTWLKINPNTGYHIVISLDKIRVLEGYNIRLAFPVTEDNIKDIKAITGAVIYGYLHRNFWFNLRTKKSVQIKGSTYHFRSAKFNFKGHAAPISVNGVIHFFNISVATASRLKKTAEKAGFIKVTKRYSEPLELPHFHKRMQRDCGVTNNIVYRKGGYRYQEIDHIIPLFFFHKRKNLKTYNKGI